MGMGIQRNCKLEEMFYYLSFQLCILIQLQSIFSYGVGVGVGPPACYHEIDKYLIKPNMQKEVEKYGTKLWAECSEFRFVERDEFLLTTMKKSFETVHDSAKKCKKDMLKLINMEEEKLLKMKECASSYQNI